MPSRAQAGIIFEHVSWIDIILIIPVLWGAYKGFKNGLIIEVFTLLALIAGVYCGIHFANFTADFLEERLKITSPYMPVISFAATFIVVVIGVYFAGKLLTKVVKIASLEFLNKLAGAIFSSCKYLIIISITLVIIKAVNGHLNFIPKEAREKSMLLEPLTELSISLFPFIVNSKFWEHIPKSEEGLESPESSEI